MKVWLVNPFDPLPGEVEQLGRYAHLAAALRDAGHQVLWWSSSFWHRFKREVDADAVRAGAQAFGIEVRLVPTPPYQKNVSLTRMRSHRAYGQRFLDLAINEPPPDVILASSPPLESAFHAARLGEKWNVPAIIDIQDQWPDNFARVMPRPLRLVSRLLFRRYYTLEREACIRAAGIVGVAQGYLDRGIEVGGHKKHEGVFPLGVSLKEVDEAIERGAVVGKAKWAKPDDQVWLLYSGSLSYNYDFLTIIHAARKAKARFGDRVRFIITGQGELAEKGRRLVQTHSLSNVTMTGFLDFDEWAYLISQVDAGFNAAFPDALIYFPNKIFYYLAAGAAVLNTIPGQCAEVVEQGECGLSYTAGDAEGCFRVIERLVDNPQERRAMGIAARRLAEKKYDRAIVYRDMTRFLEGVVEDYALPGRSNGPPK